LGEVRLVVIEVIVEGGGGGLDRRAGHLKWGIWADGGGKISSHRHLMLSNAAKTRIFSLRPSISSESDQKKVDQTVYSPALPTMQYLWDEDGWRKEIAGYYNPDAKERKTASNVRFPSLSFELHQLSGTVE
jgi:hypothetical protein